MAKAKPKKPAKKKPAKSRAKPKSKSAKRKSSSSFSGGSGRPLIVRSLDDDGYPVESRVAIDCPAGFPTGSLGQPITTVSSVADMTGPAFGSVAFNFTGTTILNVSFWSTEATTVLINRGVLQITLTNPPASPFVNPVQIQVDYIDDDDLPEPPSS
jgi:hypothetical protein